MDSLVSVVIPNYNYAHFLGRALQSVVAQTYPHWEALVVDNHSEDDTDEVVEGIGDPRIRLLKIHNHGIIAASRNLGMREARGEWIAFLDSDDSWHPGKLQANLEAAGSAGEYDVLCNDELMVDQQTGARSAMRHGPYEEDFYRVMLLEGNRLSPSATVVRRVFLDRHAIAFDESQERVTVEDYGFWLDLARAGARFKFIDSVLGECLMHGANNSGKLSRHWANTEALLRDHVFNIQRFHSSPERLWKLVSPRLGLVQARWLFAQREFGKSLGLARQTFLDSPRGTALYLVAKFKRHLREMRA